MKMDRKTKRALGENNPGDRSESKSNGNRPKRKKPSDAQFANIIEKINEGFLALDAQMNYLYINKRGSELLEREPEDLIGKNHWDEYPEDKNTSFGQAYLRALETQTPIEIEDHYAPRNRWFENRIYPTESGLSIFFNDVTERKRTHEAMRESEERFQTLANGSPVLLWVNGLEGCEFVNREYLDFLGLSAQTDVRGYDWSDFVHPEDRDAYLGAYSRAFEKQAVFSSEFRFLRSDGEYRWMRSEATPRRAVDGTFLGYVGASIDISVRKRAELALQKSEHQLSLITDAMPALISYIDSEYRYRFVNQTYQEWFGYDSEGVLGKTAMEVLGAAAFERLRPHMEAVLAGKTEDFETETPYQRGGTRFIRAIYTPDIAADGRVNGFFALVLDITERKKTEEALAEYARQQAALYQFTDRLQHTGSMEDIFDAALDAILKALQCDRASILLFDKAGVMRFVAWRGLSDDYRKTTEGHSPWMRDEENPEPICMDDIHTAELSDSLRTTIKTEGIGSLAFIPLVFNGKLIGKFMVYFNEPHAFTELETELSLTIARQLAFGIERKRDEDSLRRSEERLRIATQAARMFTWEFDIRTQVSTVANNFAEALGFSADLIPKDNEELLEEFIHPEDTQVILEALTKAVQSHSDLFSLQYRIINPENGQTIWLDVNGRVIYDQNGHPERMFGVAQNITEKKQAENRLTLLSEISELTRKLDDPVELMYAISKAVGMHLQVKRCLFNETDVEKDLEIVHRDYHNGVESVAGVHKVSDYSSVTSRQMMEGKTVVNYDSKIDPRTANDYERTYELSGERSYVAVPLLRENRWVGSLWVSDDQPRQWSTEEVSLLETIAERTWNVMEKLRINTALSASESRYRFIVENTSDGIWQIELTEPMPTSLPEEEQLEWYYKHAVIRQCNLELAHMYGYNSVEEVVGLQMQVVMPRDNPVNLELARQFIRSGYRLVDAESREVGRDGQEMVFLNNMVGVIEDGKLIGEWGTNRDITEHKRAEEERDQLLLQEQAQRAIAEQARLEAEQARAEAERELAERKMAEAALGEWADAPLPQETRPAWMRYGLAIVITVLALVLRLMLNPLMGDSLPLATLFGAVAFSVWFGGVGPALLSMILGYFGVAWFFIEPLNSIVLDARNVTGLGLFLLSSTVIVALGQGMRSAQRHAHQSARVAVERQHQVETQLQEKQRTEEALRRSEQLFSTLVDASPFGVYFIDSEFRLRAINKGSEAAFSGIEPLIGRDFAEILHIIWQEPFASEAIERFRHTLRTGESFISPPVIEQRANIEEIEAYDWQIHRITLSDGTYGVVCYFYDLSEQKKMEATVRASEELYRTIARSIPGGGVYVIDKNFRYLVAEGPVTEAFGLSREMLEGRTVMEVFPDERGERMEERLRRNFAGENVEFETQFNGHFYWTQMAPLHDSIGQTIILTIDVTERKQAEEALRESERKFSLIFHKLPFAAALSNPVDGTLVDINEAFERVFGYTRQEALGKMSVELGINPDPENRTAILAALQEQGSVRDLELELVTKPGGTRIFLLNLDMVGIGGEQFTLQTAQDITDRKQAEEALMRSEERFARFMQYLPGLAWIKDSDGRYIYANAAAEKAFNTTRENLYGRTDEEIFHPEIAAQFKRNDELALMDEKGVQVTEILEQDDGVLHYSLVNKFPIPGPDGSTTLIGGTGFDITERKQAEEALRESEERFRAILRQATAGIVRKDAEGKFIFFNDAFCNMLGYSEAELSGKTIWDFTHPDDLEENKRLYDRAMREGIPFKLEKRLIRKDGSIVWVDVSVSPVADTTSKPQSAVAIEVDITARKQAEHALAESERRFREMIDALPTAIYTTDAAGRLTHFNPAAAEFSGRVPELGTDRWCVSWKLYYPDGRPMPHDECPMAISLKEGREVRGVEAVAERPDGTRIWFEPYPTPLRDVEGRIVGGINMLVDITERKQAEEALQQLNLQLESRVQRRTVELQTVNQSLRNEIAERLKVEDALHESRRRLQILTQRLVDVQEEERRAIARELHDRVGQSLSALNINLVILDNQISDHVDQPIRTRLDDSMRLVAETINLVRDVMSDLRPPVLDDYGLEATLQSHLSAFKSRYGIDVQFEKPDQPLPRLGASIEMTFVRIAQEALINVARHAKASQVTLSLKQDGKMVCLIIQDDGEGIKSWQEANRPGSHGLTIMRERAEAFGGDLKVSSIPGKGVKVDASIPIDASGTENVEKERQK